MVDAGQSVFGAEGGEVLEYLELEPVGEREEI